MSHSCLWSRHGRWKSLISHEHSRGQYATGSLPWSVIPTPIYVLFSPWRAALLKRHYTGSSAENILVHIPKSDIYRFGDSNIAAPVFRDVDWTVKEGQNWAVVGRGSNQKTALLQVPCKRTSLGTTLTIGARRRCADTCESLPRLRLLVDSSLSCPIHRGIRIPQFLSCRLPIDPVRRGVRSTTTPRGMVLSGRKIASRSERACLGSTTS